MCCGRSSSRATAAAGRWRFDSPWGPASARAPRRRETASTPPAAPRGVAEGVDRASAFQLVKLHKEFHSQGLEVVGLSTENPDDSADSVREFVHNYNVDYRVGWSGPQVAIALMQGRDAIPQSFVISRDGRILKRFVGFSATTTPDQIRAAVQEALNDKGAAD